MLEETGLAYEIVRSEAPPSIEDDEVPLGLAGPGAILIYLAERTGRLFPVERRYRYPALQWLMFHDADGERLCGALDARLREAEFLAGVYSIADIGAYPWVMTPRRPRPRPRRLSRAQPLGGSPRRAAGGAARDGGAEGALS